MFYYIQVHLLDHYTWKTLIRSQKLNHTALNRYESDLDLKHGDQKIFACKMGNFENLNKCKEVTKGCVPCHWLSAVD
jgi:hypothetical protein